MSVIYIGNNNLLTLEGLTNCATGLVDTGATVTATLKDLQGNSVAGQSWPVALAHAGAGKYQATLDADLVLAPNRPYVAIIDATGSGSGAIGHWELPLVAKTRT